MPCDLRASQYAREKALKDLEKKLRDKSARIARRGNRVSIEGWNNRAGYCDECAIRDLKQKGDFETRRRLAQEIPNTQGITFGHGH